MIEKPLPLNRAITEVEVQEFRTLGLIPGHWIALAPLPIFCPELHLPYPDDLQTLAKLQQPLRAEMGRDHDPQRAAESESYWKKLCRRSVRPEEIEGGKALLAWFLGTRLPRLQREAYLSVLDVTAYKFQRPLPPSTSLPEPSFAIRQRMEYYLPHSAFTLYPGEPRIHPPRPEEVAEAFGPDLWKQMLVAPIAAAMAEQQVRPGSAASLVADMANVTLPSPYNKPQALEVHLASGSWRMLFAGLINPSRRGETEPAIRTGLQLAATGLASLSFTARESLLKTIHEQILRGIDRADLRKITADEWVSRVREMVEDVIRQAAPVTNPPPTPPMSSNPPQPSEAAPASGATSGKGADQPAPAVAPTPTSEAAAVPATSAAPPPAAASPPPPAPPPPAPPKPVVTVERASPFTMVSLEEARARAAKTTVAEIRTWMERKDRPGMLFDNRRTECAEVAIVRDAAEVPEVLWLVGDVHADVLTLANIIAHAERLGVVQGIPPAFVFLGDFVDRGQDDHDMLLLLFQLIMKDPERVCIIPGNHDIDLQWDEKNQRFRVTIEPAEYCEQLNAVLRSGQKTTCDEVELARLAIAFWQSRPRAVILPDGTLLAHAGFPHTDMQGLLKTPADLAKAPCLNDFLWARISETARKRPNRGNRGHEFGWETFASFCRTMTQMGVPVKRFVRGHDHVPNRWQFYPDYAENPVLTINAMGRRMDGEPEPADGPHPYPVMARHVPGQLPVVVPLPLAPREVDRAFGREPAINPNPAASADAANLADAIDEVLNGVRVDPVPKPESEGQAK